MCYQSDKPRAYAECIQFGVGAWQKKRTGIKPSPL